MRHLLTSLLLALVVSLTACAPPLSLVHVRTDPPGGKVRIDETGALLEDGAQIGLERGTYHFSPADMPVGPDSVTLAVNGSDEAHVLVPTQRDILPGRFNLRTQPPGGSVLVLETQRTVADGEQLTLAPGRYRLQPALKGYRPAEVVIDVLANREEELFIDLGTGYAQLTLTTSPPGANLLVDGQARGVTPIELELESGTHQIDLELNGFLPHRRQLKLAAGVEQTLDISLQPEPTSALVHMTTNPPGGQVFLANRPMGQGKVNLGRLPFGTYSVRGVKTLNDLQRLVGEMSFTLKEDRPYQLTLPLTQPQRQFAGQWYPEAQALQREQRRYQSQRVARPLLVELNSADLQTLRAAESEALVNALHGLLRVGDRIQVTQADKTWLVWKRHLQPSPEFKAMVAALVAGNRYSLPFAADTVEKVVSTLPGTQPLTELAFALHRARAQRALLDLAQPQLAAIGTKIQRSLADGPLTIIAASDSELSLPGSPRQLAKGLWLTEIAAADDPVELNWAAPPQHLLVVSDSGSPLVGQLPGALLLAFEKQIVALAEGVKVQHLVRLSNGPDYPAWHRQEFVLEGPLAGQLDLSRDELGPNEHFGDYQRIWLITYQNQGQLTQRQLAGRYQVVKEKKEFGSDKFLRRNSSAP